MRRLLLLLALCVALALVLAPMAMAQDPGAYNCSDFSTQEEAQAFFEANDPANDPYLLDEDDGVDDGVACETLPSGGGDDIDEDQYGVDEEQYGVDEVQYEMETGPTTASPSAELPETGGPSFVAFALPTMALLIASGLLTFRIVRR